jgi:hypothetical protein
MICIATSIERSARSALGKQLSALHSRLFRRALAEVGVTDREAQVRWLDQDLFFGKTAAGAELQQSAKLAGASGVIVRSIGLPMRVVILNQGRSDKPNLADSPSRVVNVELFDHLTLQVQPADRELGFLSNRYSVYTGRQVEPFMVNAALVQESRKGLATENDWVDYQDAATLAKRFGSRVVYWLDDTECQAVLGCVEQAAPAIDLRSIRTLVGDLAVSEN